MEMSRQPHVYIDDMSAVGEARRLAARLCKALHAREELAGNVALVVTEVATNLVKHARGGEMVFRILGEGEEQGIEILAVDRGPGIDNLGESLRDGFSTSGSPGGGLGAIRRISAGFDIFSSPGSGTVMMSRVSTGASPAGSSGPVLQAGALKVPVEGEEECGDDWALALCHGRVAAFVVDGIGHGLEAVEASRAAVSIFSSHAEEGPEAVLRRVHDALRCTRGAVAAITEIDPAGGKVRFAGLGNIGAIIFSGGERRSLVSHNGTLGQEARKIQEFSYPWSREALLLMCSDGISMRWQLSDYPGLEYRHPSLVAGALYRDYGRKRDDITILAMRMRSPQGGAP